MWQSFAVALVLLVSDAQQGGRRLESSQQLLVVRALRAYVDGRQRILNDSTSVDLCHTVVSDRRGASPLGETDIRELLSLLGSDAFPCVGRRGVDLLALPRRLIVDTVPIGDSSGGVTTVSVTADFTRGGRVCFENADVALWLGRANAQLVWCPIST